MFIRSDCMFLKQKEYNFAYKKLRNFWYCLQANHNHIACTPDSKSSKAFFAVLHHKTTPQHLNSSRSLGTPSEEVFSYWFCGSEDYQLYASMLISPESLRKLEMDETNST